MQIGAFVQSFQLRIQVEQYPGVLADYKGCETLRCPWTAGSVVPGLVIFLAREMPLCLLEGKGAN